MPYLGRSPVIGSFKKIDNITSQFTGAQTVFTLQAGGTPVTPGTAQNLIVSLGGVLQEPGVAYTVNASTLTFTGAPANTQPFFGVMLGDAVDVGWLTDGVSINVSSMSVSANVLANTSALLIGNATVNAVHTATSYTVANSTNTATLTPVSLTIGTQVSNTLGFYAGANVYATTTTLFAGNSTANVVILSTSVTAANSTNTATLTPVSLTIGTQAANTLGFYSGANVIINTTTVFVGNATVNAVHTATSYTVANSTNTATLTPVSLTIGTQVVNTTAIFDAYGSLRTIPVPAKTTAYTLAAADTGQTLSTNASVTVNGAILSANQIFTIYNNSTGNITISSGAGVTMYLSGSAATGDRTLAQKGLATILCVAANTFVISGTGLL